MSVQSYEKKKYIGRRGQLVSKLSAPAKSKFENIVDNKYCDITRSPKIQKDDK